MQRNCHFIKAVNCSFPKFAQTEKVRRTVHFFKPRHLSAPRSARTISTTAYQTVNLWT